MAEETKHIDIQAYLDLLGYEVKDKVTKFEGVVTSIGFDLYGCIQAIVNPKIDKDGKPSDSRWFDIGRLKVTSKEPVMDQPDFEQIAIPILGKKGPAEKPANSRY